MGIKVTEGRPDRKPLGQRQGWLQMGQLWKAERKFRSVFVAAWMWGKRGL